MDRTYTVFADGRRIAAGALPVVLVGAWRHREAHPEQTILAFDDETGRAVDLDLRGTEAEMLAREVPGNEGRGEPPARGRPKLGVVSREVSLLPRHWEWLEQQPNGISAALRRLVEEARRSEPGAQRARRVREATSRLLTALAGDLPGYEEASRALFARDTERFAACVSTWPPDVRAHLLTLVERAAALEAENTTNT